MNASSPRGAGAAPAVLGLLLTGLAALLGILRPAFLEVLDYRAFDALSAPAPDADVSAVPVIVDIDEKSLRRHGQWPWPRYKLALLLDRLHAMGVQAIGIDIMFPERDRTALDPATDEIPAECRAAIEAAGLREFARSSDRLFTEAVSRSAAVLGFQFLFEPSPESTVCRLDPIGLNWRRNGGGPFSADVMEAAGVVCNLEELARAAHSTGFFNVSPDRDGLLRSVPLLMKYKGEFYPSLALAVLMKVSATSQLWLHHDSSGDALQLAKTKIPLASGGRLWVNYRGGGRTFAYVSAADLLSGQTPPEALAGKIVFIGTSAAGLKEFRSTPLDPVYPGVEVHATVVDNVLRSHFLRRPFYAVGLEVLLALITGIAFTAVFNRSSALATLLAAGAGAAGLWALCGLAFRATAILLSPVLALLVLAANFSSMSLLRFWLEERKAKQRARELALAQEAIIESMASLTETRDPETGGHIKRTQNYVRLLAEALQGNPKHRNQLGGDAIALLYKSAPLHDIGKVGVPDSILLKPGRLTEAEFEEMKKHAVIGRDAIQATAGKLGNPSFLRVANEIAYTHHEKWDGSGYPQGLRGEAIPLSGRLMALADAYDALISRRVYKSPLPHAAAVQIIVKEKGTHFDPDVVDAFLATSEEFHRIARQYEDA